MRFRDCSSSALVANESDPFFVCERSACALPREALTVSPLTASQIKKFAFDEYEDAERELISVYDDALGTLDGDRRALLQQSQGEWGSFITASARLLPTLNLRPIWPVNSYEHLTRLTRERSAFLYLLKENQLMEWHARLAAREQGEPLRK
jgi:uncharacterized protein YecT (DUF1311 family)